MRTVCVDPNVMGCGLAVFEEDELVLAKYVSGSEWGRDCEYQSAGRLAYCVKEALLRFDRVDRLLIELPVFYGSTHKKGDPNDTRNVGLVGASVASKVAASSIVSITPSQWKGQLEKKKMLERIRSKLLPHELSRIEKCNKSDMEDVLDAVGIGLWSLGRLNKKVYPGASE